VGEGIEGERTGQKNRMKIGEKLTRKHNPNTLFTLARVGAERRERLTR
jgi:hypothetical protein